MATGTEETKALLRTAAIRARLAPSVHNTQPWRFVVRPNALELYADDNRQLRALDPTRRQLLISCGCALFNARVALATTRVVHVDRFPDDQQPDLLARLTLTDQQPDWTPLVRLEPVIERRHTNRRDFFEENVPPEVIYELVTAAEQEEASLASITTPQRKLGVAQLCQEADEIQNADPRYRSELLAWTTDDLHRPDGVPVSAVPHRDASTEADLPTRKFDLTGKGWLPTLRQSSLNQCLVVLGTSEDTPRAWLRAGEALERVWLEATRLDYVISLATQVVEVPATRERLRQELNLQIYPHILMRIGQAAPTPTSQRREPSTVISESDD